MIRATLLRCLSLLPVVPALAQPARQTQSDDYTRYELLAPGSGQFRILYEVTANTPGATTFFNVIRRGSTPSDIRVTDVHTGKSLAFDMVRGDVARAGGLPNADTATRYIRIALARPVPRNGETRLLIDKTYLDTASYRAAGDSIVFTRSLGIKRNAIALPPGYEVVSSTYPSQVLQEEDGRITVAFWNSTPADAPVSIRARRAPAASAGDDGLAPELRRRLVERAHQTREIVYYLQQPETHSFDLYHDYTETRPGVDRYLNVVRAGSRVSNPRAVHLDTGEELPFDVQRGDSEVVVFRFPPVNRGETVRIRMYETYTDSARYRLTSRDAFVWDRTLGRPANAVVLPQGWILTNSAIPATVTELGDGRLRLDFINPRPDDIAVLITGRRRAP